MLVCRRIDDRYVAGKLSRARAAVVRSASVNPTSPTFASRPKCDTHDRQYMDVPTLPSVQFMRVCRIRLHQYIRTLVAAEAAVPDGFG